MAPLEIRLRLRIDTLIEQREDARRKNRDLERKLERLHTCGFCGAPAEHGVCTAHSDLAKEAVA